jgi:hypothetical protein
MFYDRDGHRITGPEWVALCNGNPTGVALSQVWSGHRACVTVSTIWSGLDPMPSGLLPPMVYETATWGRSNWTQVQGRWATEAQALAGHAEVVAAVAFARPGARVVHLHPDLHRGDLPE